MILTEVTEDELNTKAEKLRGVSKKYKDLVFAIGAAYESSVNNVRTALQKADMLMYEDKKRYYELHPEKKRGVIDKRNG